MCFKKRCQRSFLLLFMIVNGRIEQYRLYMSNNGQSAKRASFSGKIGYVLAVAGSAVGLGNIWRFPYLAAKYGGGIFLLVYLILTVSFGYVLIMSETALGRMTRKTVRVL